MKVGHTTSTKLSKQMSPDKQESMESMKAAASATTSISGALSGSNFFVNILLAGSLSLLWGLINALQLTTHFPLVNIVYPMNAAIWYDALFGLASLDIVSTEGL